MMDEIEELKRFLLSVCNKSAGQKFVSTLDTLTRRVENEQLREDQDAEVQRLRKLLMGALESVKRHRGAVDGQEQPELAASLDLIKREIIEIKRVYEMNALVAENERLEKQNFDDASEIQRQRSEILRLSSEISRLRAALEWYADPEYWHRGNENDSYTDACSLDKGNLARKALEGPKA